MKKLSSILSQFCMALVFGLIAFACHPAFCLTFTNNANIGPANTNYEGLDITVSNSTLVVDGSHAFNSLRIAAGGVVTHSFSPVGTVSNLYYMTNEAQVLYGTTPVTLLNSNVITSTVIVVAYGGTTIYSNGVDYLLSSPDGLVTQLQRTANSAIPDGGIVLVSYEGFGATQGTVPAGLNLTISNNVQVDAGGAINANGIGYSVGPGIGGSGASGGGGGYGGNGGPSANAAGGVSYGVFNALPNLGSGGGNGGAGSGGVGGGLVQITALGNIIINGLITANGANGTNDRSGGGSGGGIFMTANALFGSGAVTANGGMGEPTLGGGGGGGRISLQYNTTSFTGGISAFGGLGSSFGTAGTIYTKLPGQNGLIVFDNGGHKSQTNSSIAQATGAFDMLIRSNASVTPTGSLAIGTLTIASNGFMVANNLTTLNILVNGAMTVQQGGAIVANGAGFAQNSGTASGHSFNDGFLRPCGGGGYGGYGASSPSNSLALGGATYGNQSSPVGYGSGGGGVAPNSIGGNGGGDIQIMSQGGIVQVDGVISANGLNGSGTGGGGGAGGTVWLSGGTLVGAGSITANGGNGVSGVGGGGGGGRIQISPTANLFSGSITAYGGDGGARAGAGTVFIQASGQTSQLIVDNNGHFGTNTPVQGSVNTDLIVRGGGVACASAIVNFANLYVNSNGWIFPFFSQGSQGGQIGLSLDGNATIQAGGGIIADSAGFPAGQGENNGAGHAASFGSTNLCSGGGHGGPGGNSFGNYAFGGGTYDTIANPLYPGSGGGAFTPLSPGGSGGGLILISVSGTLEVDGIISANGGNGSGLAGGGGSGGSIRLSAGALGGVGTITANGGNGANALGGGGGGGIISLPLANNFFSGTSTAYGGGGANRGGAGPVFLQTVGKNSQFILDGGGNPGPATVLSTSITSSMDVTVRNGATGFISGSLSTGNVIVGPNSTLITSNLSSLNCTTLTVQAGGNIIADAQNSFGNALGQSSPASNYPCGGGGNGGPGGNSIGNIAAGGVNLLYYQAAAGSAGGSESPYSLGGLGGGLVSITSTGSVQIDGTISAGGGNGSGNGGGGGAGGSISLTCGSFAGIGTIRANGGAGVGSIGGGGGGGMIFITVNSSANQFNGTVTAYGGAGANRGGTGPITITTTGQPVQYILDAGGNAATPSALNPPVLSSLTLRNGAIGLVGPNQSTVSLGTLLITSNSFLYVTNSLVTTISFTNGTVQTGGGIIADAFGFGPGLGSGSGRVTGSSPYFPCGGGGHGGVGGNSISNLALGGTVYDSQLSPNTPGSGGGTLLPNSLGGAGGGAVVLSVIGTFQVDGVVSANGSNGSGTGGGGGAGGTVRITGGSLAGLGSIRANGGNGAANIGGGGGGGMIAILSATNSFTGSFSALGGAGANRGGAGTLYFQTSQTSQNGQLVLDNGGQPGGLTPIQSASSSLALILRNGVVAYPINSSQTFGSILIASNAMLIANTNTGTLNLTFTGNATIQPGGGIIADGQGSPQSSGPGAGQLGNGGSGGAGYGGNGGNGITNHAIGGAAYGSISSPTSLGSGGGGDVPFSIGGTGGGAIRLTVTGTLDVSGTISADGNNGGGNGGGGGSGGSVYLTVGTLTGVGAITANGGNGAQNVSGGGGGGRISVAYTANSFLGLTVAYGGIGFVNGGAGTIYSKANNKSVGQVLADNGGLAGTNTPIGMTLGVPTTPFDVVAQNGAIVGPQPNTLFPELNNLTLKSGGELTGLPGSTLDVTVVNSVDVTPGGAIVLDGEGYAQHVGLGAGQIGNGTGGGAGYGGAGGASVSAAGGLSYGSATQPVDFGSGGGTGTGTIVGGSAGGGALRLNVGGVLTVDGAITSEGQSGLQDDSGGGSGGSIWVTAGMLAGSGDVAADGGEGQLYYGGGGAGGRIALYCRTNAFFGATSAAGAAGYAAGANGTIVLSNNVAPLVVLFSKPDDTESTSVSTALISFSGAPNPTTVSSATVSINTPNGLLSASSLSITMVNSSTYQVGFPAQTTPGNYALLVNQGVTDLYGRQLAQSYTQAFSISLPVIQGTITDALGNPLAGVTLQNSGGFTPATTDTNGNYTLGFVPGSTFTVTPALANYSFTPPSLSYTSATGSIAGQNYTGTSTLAPAPALATVASGNSLAINWQGVAGVNYHIYSSTNLIDWVPCGICYSGSNGPAQCLMPIGTNAVQFFTVQPGN